MAGIRNGAGSIQAIEIYDAFAGAQLQARMIAGEAPGARYGLPWPDRTLADTHGGVGTVCFSHILEGE
ncbi:hypothetical protein Q672_06810 [Marinobacter sp. EVN1]|jgi:hypothetical protein|uniref:hypothetical protein n=1 Tax=Marinobacter sp. EVN1 TaxID=1397532 RepID=UPI0003B8D350|nr:hypothetical protein [Marinobacter sp. EVN1]ERS81017.1 hypothetical protein Q672_06810 [Marinobacter sp. EVN1]